MKPGDTAIVYACELLKIKGNFDPSKAAALGLRPGILCSLINLMKWLVMNKTLLLCLLPFCSTFSCSHFMIFII
jgi:hypothetical protein